jgi:hypothetical protein
MTAIRNAIKSSPGIPMGAVFALSVKSLKQRKIPDLASKCLRVPVFTETRFA